MAKTDIVNIDTSSFEDTEKCIKYSLHSLKDHINKLLNVYPRRLKDKRLKNDKLDVRKYKNDAIHHIADMKWYLNTLTHRLGITEDEIKNSLSKNDKKWGSPIEFEAGFAEREKFPRNICLHFYQIPGAEPANTLTSFYTESVGWIQIGDVIDDNSNKQDFYRFHDIFHFGYVVFLGWSPVVRRMFKRKRKSDKKIDRVEDGARAANIEEAMTSFIFEDAKSERNLYKNNEPVDFYLLKTIKKLTAGLEVSRAPPDLWEKAILEGYKIFNELVANQCGYVYVSLDKQELKYSKSPPNPKNSVASKVLQTLRNVSLRIPSST